MKTDLLEEGKISPSLRATESSQKKTAAGWSEQASEQGRPAAHAWIEGPQWRQHSSPAGFGGEEFLED